MTPLLSPPPFELQHDLLRGTGFVVTTARDPQTDRPVEVTQFEVGRYSQVSPRWLAAYQSLPSHCARIYSADLEQGWICSESADTLSPQPLATPLDAETLLRRILTVLAQFHDAGLSFDGAHSERWFWRPEAGLRLAFIPPTSERTSATIHADLEGAAHVVLRWMATASRSSSIVSPDVSLVLERLEQAGYDTAHQALEQCPTERLATEALPATPRIPSQSSRRVRIAPQWLALSILCLGSLSGGWGRTVEPSRADASVPSVVPSPTVSRHLPPGLVPVDSTPETNGSWPARIRSEKLGTGAERMEFVRIDPGEYPFGVQAPDTAQPGELAEGRTRLMAPLYCAVTEVTWAQFSRYAPHSPGVLAAQQHQELQLPATGISHADALNFCRWLSLHADLPTEQEWEAIARQSSHRYYPWGDGFPIVSERAHLLTNLPATSCVPVFQLPAGATAHGIHHLLGNAAEWCRDVYIPGTEETAADPGAHAWPAIRGGSYLTQSSIARLTWRASCDPEGARDVGFRVIIRPQP